MWNSKFPLSDCQPVDEDDSLPVYRSYPRECNIEINTPEKFNAFARLYKIYIESDLLKPLVFTPKVQPLQTTSDYYFMKLDFKIPRPN